ncbi:aspartate carbamoyltransferase regulatory subunit [Alkalitalea saponilacus]|uniref:Aspartate carbamoyltransferase regulatory chain n=1 Tax=Alkalitalea saponilacus TaxID=889453 RepID=A0A1T5DA23_9BACT|nr:aspartate carbamoyltransferase regulatory subunit [Alkalitalea saponilacus]ASB50635.1 aspartate carbamoyltransferase regulatory subunit [Alkalitalea saponilacus]SKB68456.1 aspartate carbamoyltransferase regulatory subunit [Alkalitalea saponilacus]
MSKQKQLQVSAIENGTVIDHIPAESLFDVINILGLDQITNLITFGTNLDSDKLGKKAIIKVEGKFFEDNEINKISLVAPHVKLNIIRDYEVVEKRDVEIPDEVVGIVKCFNPKCITNNEVIKTHFKVMDKTDLALKCHYCEKNTTRDELKMN